MKVKRIIRQLDRMGLADDILDVIGLEPRGSGLARFFGNITLFALGALVGAGVGLLAAPVPGVEMREKARARLTEMRGAVGRMGQGSEQRAT
jgi:hypothetical protein